MWMWRELSFDVDVEGADLDVVVEGVELPADLDVEGVEFLVDLDADVEGVELRQMVEQSGKQTHGR